MIRRSRLGASKRKADPARGILPRQASDAARRAIAKRNDRDDDGPSARPSTTPKTATDWATRQFASLKAQFPNYTNWGTAPTTRSGINDLRSQVKQWASGLKSNTANTTTTTAPTTTPATPATPASQTGTTAIPAKPASPYAGVQSWANTVNSYFPQTMKAGGLVRGGGAAQRGVGKGKMT